jgi:hypothetical protein
MAIIPLLFLALFILVQGTLGILLLYRGYRLVLESFEVEKLNSWLMVAINRVKAAVTFVDQNSGLRREVMIVAFLIPGSIPLLLLFVLWRLARRSEVRSQDTELSIKTIS